PDQARKEVEAVRVDAVTRRVGDQTRAELRASVGQAGRHERTVQRVVQILIGDLHQSGNNTRAMRLRLARLKASRSSWIPAVVFVLVAVRGAAAQTPAPPILQEPQTMLLWPDGAPGALGQEDRD